MSKLDSILEDFKKAVLRLHEVLEQEKNDIMRDSAIKRFEIVFDLAWKTIKAYLEEKKGVVCASPKPCFKEAYKQSLIEYDNFWLELTDARNETVHVYNEDFAEKTYALLPKALIYFKELLENLEKEMNEEK